MRTSRAMSLAPARSVTPSRELNHLRGGGSQSRKTVRPRAFSIVIPPVAFSALSSARRRRPTTRPAFAAAQEARFFAPIERASESLGPLFRLDADTARDALASTRRASARSLAARLRSVSAVAHAV